MSKQYVLELTEITYAHDSNGFSTTYNTDDFSEPTYSDLKTRKSTSEIPIDIFSTKLAPLQALCLHLQSQNFSNRQIGILLNRDPRTIHDALSEAIKADPESKYQVTNKTSSGLQVPLIIFHNRKLSILEHVISHLRSHGMRNIDIAKLLVLDPRTTNTCWHRAKKKRGGMQ
ncbi:MAG: hypothetical protein ABIA93_04165 [Candidatus Woesearchaeota archaeon]